MEEQRRIQIVVGSPDTLGVEYFGAYCAQTYDLALVGHAQTMPALRAVLDTTPLDVVLIDTYAVGGVAVLHELVARYPRSVIVMASLQAYDAALMAVGARGYYTDDDPVDELHAIIRAVAAGQTMRSTSAEACWQWYREHGDTPMTPVQAAALLRHYGIEPGGLRRVSSA